MTKLNLDEIEAILRQPIQYRTSTEVYDLQKSVPMLVKCIRELVRAGSNPGLWRDALKKWNLE
jgi:hypothetical protein